jgi:hypothetical protein
MIKFVLPILLKVTSLKKDMDIEQFQITIGISATVKTKGVVR